MTILEKNGVEQTFFDGATINNFITNGQNGRIYGLETAHTATTVSVSAGVLIVRGYRIVFANENIFTLNSYPTTSENTNLILSITVSGNSVTASVSIGNPSHHASIDRTAGTYDYVMARIRITPNGIADCVSQISTITLNSGKSEYTACGITLVSTDPMNESSVTALAATRDNGIYRINTVRNGAELLFKNGSYRARFTSAGAILVYKSQTGEWLEEDGNNIVGTNWFYGNLGAGNIPPENMPEGMKVGDYYINTSLKKIIKCTGYGGTSQGTTCYFFTKIIDINTDTAIGTDLGTTAIQHTFSPDADFTYGADNITLAQLFIPSSVSHGFKTRLNIRSSPSAPLIYITNQSEYAARIIVNGFRVETYAPAPFCTIRMDVECDGISVNINITEIPEIISGAN